MSQTARVKNPTHSELRLHSTCFKGMCPSMFRSPEDAYATFQQVKVILNNKGVDFMAPCGKQNLHDCDLFKHISVCNDVLAAIQVHIDELVETREVAVCFSATTSDREEPREDVQRAVVLLHRLLVKHICVATIVLDDLGWFCNQGLFSILCNGISKCRGLKSLRVNAVNDEASYYRQLLTGCLSLENLEEVCFKRIRDSNRGIMAILAGVIERNTKLSTFKVDRFLNATRFGRTLLLALQQCQTLCHISLDVTCFGENEATLFLNMLATMNALKTLHLKSAVGHEYITVSGIASALSTSTTLVNLELRGFCLHTVDVEALATSLVHVETLRTLILHRCIPAICLTDGHVQDGAHKTRPHYSSRIAPYINAIEQFRGLRCLVVDLLHFSSE